MTVMMGLDARLRTAQLYVIVDAREHERDMARYVDALFAGGADIVSVRTEGLDRKRALAALEAARNQAFGYQGLIVVDGDAELAGAFTADVLHLGAAGGPSAPARKQLHQWALLGRSANDEAQVKAALADPVVNYLLVGDAAGQAGAPALPLIRQAARLAPAGNAMGKPWFAVGGINEANIDDVIAAGARRVAVETAVARAKDPQGVCERLAAALKRAWNDDPAMQAYLGSAFGKRPAATFTTPDVGPVTGPSVGEAEGLGKPVDAPLGSNGRPPRAGQAVADNPDGDDAGAHSARRP